LHAALSAVAENLIGLFPEALKSVRGYFHVLPAAKEIVSRETFLTFVKPYA